MKYTVLVLLNVYTVAMMYFCLTMYQVLLCMFVWKWKYRFQLFSTQLALEGEAVPYFLEKTEMMSKAGFL